MLRNAIFVIAAAGIYRAKYLLMHRYNIGILLQYPIYVSFYTTVFRVYTFDFTRYMVVAGLFIWWHNLLCNTKPVVTNNNLFAMNQRNFVFISYFPIEKM